MRSISLSAWQSQDLNEPIDAGTYVVEVTSSTALAPTTQQGALPMQTLRQQAIQRTLDMKRVLKGLVDLARVE
jgi:hypothetical protein